MTFDHNIEKITQTEVLSLGWTKKLIEQLLPIPELKDNPRYKCSPKMKLWVKSDVLKMMKSVKFKEAQINIEKSRNAAKKAVDTKTRKIMTEIEEKIKLITVIVIDDDVLIKNTLTAKQNWYDNITCNSGFSEFRNVYDANQETVTRWIVNYIRHNLTNYDENLYNLSGRVGCHKAYSKYRLSVLNQIASFYPKYFQECNRQITGEERC